MADNYANPLKEAETDITKAQKAINGLLEPKQEAKAEEPKEEIKQNSPEPQKQSRKMKLKKKLPKMYLKTKNKLKLKRNKTPHLILLK